MSQVTLAQGGRRSLLNILIPKLPAPKEEDLAEGILEAIDMDSHRVEKKAVMKIALASTTAASYIYPSSNPILKVILPRAG